MLIFCLYSLLFIGMALLDAKKSASPAAFFLNGRASGALHTGFSLIASCVGGSATIGMAGLAFAVGAPAFWWLGSGAIGLIFLTIFLARKVRESGVYTMPELITRWLGPNCRAIAAAVIAIAWLAILAAQFTAMGKLIGALTSLEENAPLLAGAALVILYSFLGGQSSVIRSDLPQGIILIAGLGAVFCWLLLRDSSPLQNLPLEAINADFPASRLTYFLLILGGSYLVCPMLFGRILSARDAKCASRGCWLAVFGLLGAAVLITAIGVLCRGFAPAGTAPDDVLVTAMNLLPPWLGLLLLLALLSAVLSSADSCLITAATVISNDLLRRRDVRCCRVIVLLLGGLGILLALQGRGILALLLLANDIYVCGVALPVFIAMLHNRPARPLFAEIALITGGICGVLGSWCALPQIGYGGMACAALLLLAGRQRDAKRAVA